MIKLKKICPSCRRESIPKIKVHDLDEGDAILITETCGYCRTILHQRHSTNQLERIRKDISSLQDKVDSGSTHLADVLEHRKTRYNILLRELAK